MEPSIEDLVLKQLEIATEGNIYREVVQAFEAPLFRQVYQRMNKNTLASAKVLGINRNTLRKKLKTYGVKVCPKTRPL